MQELLEWLRQAKNFPASMAFMRGLWQQHEAAFMYTNRPEPCIGRHRAGMIS